MDHQQSSFIWDEGHVDIVPSFLASVGSGVWRVEARENCGLFFRIYKVLLIASSSFCSSLSHVSKYKRTNIGITLQNHRL